MAESAAEEEPRLRREVEAHDRAAAQVPDDPFPDGGTVEEMQAHTRRWWARVDELVRADLGYVPRKLTFRERMTDGRGLQLYRSTPADIVRWARESRPPVNVADVAAHVARLREAGILTAADEDKVERLLPELGFASA